MTKTIITKHAAETEQVAAKIGKHCRGGEVIELCADLGGGKTTFVRGLARGLGSSDHVSSPTFKISNIYAAGDKELHHFDFYRLPEAGLISQEVDEVCGQPNVIVVLEWAGAVQDVLPTKRLTITFTPTGDESRRLDFSCAPDLAYLLEGVSC